MPGFKNKQCWGFRFGRIRNFQQDPDTDPEEIIPDPKLISSKTTLKNW